MSKGKFYVTTPIYYPSDKLHIGHAYTTVYCDVLSRWNRFMGNEVLFATGSDEHGQKIERAAKAKGKQPQEYVNEIVATFRELWKRLNISYDVFIRTSETRHQKVVQSIFQKLYDQGDIYKDVYTGWYCTPCEAFWPESKLNEERLCPDCGRSVELVQEESYFFRISKYADRLLKHIEENPDFIQPAARRNEMVSFIKQGLEELCVSRTTFDWGIRVPFDEKHVIYVWIDALSNYITACGYLQDDEEFKKWWPAELHVVGKDILRFHTIIWPCILMALGLPLPKQVYGHGWLLVDGGKMSKSKGTVVDPNRLIDEYGTDAIRYFLLREVSYGQDAKYSKRVLVERINSDLANDLGNALYRSLAMLKKYFDGIIPEPARIRELDSALKQEAVKVVEEVTQQLAGLEVNQALIAIWRLVGSINKYIDTAEPWTLAKDPELLPELKSVMYHIFEALRVVAVLIAPFMPDTAKKMYKQLGLTISIEEQGLSALSWGNLPGGTKTQPQQPLFPRLDLEEILKEEEELETNAANPPQASAAEEKPVAKKHYISYDQFKEVELKVAKILSANRIEGADKLLQLQVDLGSEQRQIVAGIAKHYDPQDLPGKNVVLVANLEPATIRGVRSEGMILAVVDGEYLEVLQLSEKIRPGSRVS
jgi:methionyl-tRNA synthetase